MLIFAWIAIIPACCYGHELQLLFEGRLEKGTKPADFDADRTSYLTNIGAKGFYQSWSDVISTGYTPSSFFDMDKYQPFQMTLTDRSLFPPTPGFRRVGLTANVTFDAGITTFHFSAKKNPDRPLNMKHQYELISLQSIDNRKRIFELRYGTDYTNSTAPEHVDANTADQLRIMISDVHGSGQMRPLFQTRFTPDTFHNFAVIVNWEAENIWVYYSKGNEPLQEMLRTVSNPVEKPAELCVGLLKLPVGVSENIALEGYQETGICEAIIYGGIFVEVVVHDAVRTGS